MSRGKKYTPEQIICKLRTDQAKRLKAIEKQNARLKRLLADAELDKAILKEAASGNF